MSRPRKSHIASNRAALSDIPVFIRHEGVDKVLEEYCPKTIYQPDKAYRPYVSVVQVSHPVGFAKKYDVIHHVLSSSSQNISVFRCRYKAIFQGYFSSKKVNSDGL